MVFEIGDMLMIKYDNWKPWNWNTYIQLKYLFPEGEWEWEESDEEEKVEFKAEVREEKPDIKIQGSLITIDRTKV